MLTKKQIRGIVTKIKNKYLEKGSSLGANNIFVRESIRVDDKTHFTMTLTVTDGNGYELKHYIVSKDYFEIQYFKGGRCVKIIERKIVNGKRVQYK